MDQTESSRRLATFVQSLPQELIDQILACFMTIPLHRKQVEISAGYTPPWPLHLNRQHRDDFAKDYYRKTIFHSRSERLLTRWLLSLPAKHVLLLKHVRLVQRPQDEKNRLGAEIKKCELREEVKMRLVARDVEMGDVKFLTVWTS